MNGLINKAIQCFLRDGWGMPAWLDAARAAGVAPRGFEPMLDYPPEVTERLLQAASDRLDRGRDDLLEDLGTYLVRGGAAAVALWRNGFPRLSAIA